MGIERFSINMPGGRARGVLVAASIASVLSWSACDPLQAIEDEGCGNHVINLNEDCDGPGLFGNEFVCGVPNTPNACFFVCADSDCPPGWGCGADDRCRRPGGEFDAKQGGTVALENFAVDDVDGDGAVDLVGSGGPWVSVRYGEGDGDFQEGLDLPIPQPTGDIAFGQYTVNDTRLDMVVPIVAGFFSLLGTEARTLEPYNYAPFDTPLLPREPMQPREPALSGRVLVVDAADEPAGTPVAREALFLLDDHMMMIEFAAPDPRVAPNPSGGTVADLTTEIPRADLNGDKRTDIVLLYRGAPEAVLYTTVQPEGLLPYAPMPAILMPTGYGITDPGGFFMDVDGDADLDLVFTVVPMGSEVGEVAVALQTGPGTFEGMARLDHSLNDADCNDAQLTLDEPWPLAAADLNGDGLTDYVYHRGLTIAGDVTATCPYGMRTLTNVPVGAGEWDLIELLDINADGALDVATASTDVAGVDVLLNNDLADRTIFSRFHLGSDAPTKALLSGDYNGDLLVDLAFVEDGGPDPDRLSTVYGAFATGPSEVVDMGSVNNVESADTGSTLQGMNGTDVAADVVMLVRPIAPPAQMQPAMNIALMFGDPSRKMVSPFLLGHLRNYDYFPTATIIGEFNSPATRTVDNGTDVAVILAGGELDGPFIIMAEGKGGQGNAITQFDAVARLPSDAADFNAACARWTAGPLSPDGTGEDTIVGVDFGPTCDDDGPFQPRLLLAANVEDVLIPRTVPPPQPLDPMDIGTLPTTWALLPVEGSSIVHLEIVNLDEDDDNDLLIVLGGMGMGDGGSVLILWNDEACGEARLCPGARYEIQLADLAGVPWSNDPMFPMQMRYPTRILDATPIQLDMDAAPELAVLVDLGVVALDLTSDGTYQPSLDEPLIERTGQGLDQVGRLRTADVDNDGLEDLVINAEGRVNIGLQLTDETLGQFFDDNEGAIDEYREDTP